MPIIQIIPGESMATELAACSASVLRLQRQLIADTRTASPLAGFLVTAFQPAELEGVLARGGRLFASYEAGTLLGFALLAPLAEFTQFYADPGVGTFTPSDPVDLSRCEYLYQIAIARPAARRGIGTALVERCKVEASGGLVADVLVDPISNEAAIGFFRRSGFREAGELRVPAYRDIGDTRWRVLHWQWAR